MTYRFAIPEFGVTLQIDTFRSASHPLRMATKIPRKAQAGHPDASETAKSGGLPAWLAALALGLVAILTLITIFRGSVLDKASFGGVMDFSFSRPAATPVPVASRDFVIGRWEVEQPSGERSSGTQLAYENDGTFSGWASAFNGSTGIREHWTGTWSFEKLSDTSFRMTILMPGVTRQATFRIFDHDHIQNTGDNYVAVRVP